MHTAEPQRKWMGDQRKPGNLDLEKEMWISFKYSWRNCGGGSRRHNWMEIGDRQVVYVLLPAIGYK